MVVVVLEVDAGDGVGLAVGVYQKRDLRDLGIFRIRGWGLCRIVGWVVADVSMIGGRWGCRNWQMSWLLMGG